MQDPASQTLQVSRGPEGWVGDSSTGSCVDVWIICKPSFLESACNVYMALSHISKFRCCTTGRKPYIGYRLSPRLHWTIRNPGHSFLKNVLYSLSIEERSARLRELFPSVSRESDLCVPHTHTQPLCERPRWDRTERGLGWNEPSLNHSYRIF